MQIKLLKLAAIAPFLLCSSAAIAIPFATFETRSMGMGGVGVAIGSPDAAPLFNPALLSVSKPQDDFSLLLPSVGISVSDPSKLRDAIDSFNSVDTIGTMNTHLTQLNTAIGAANQAGIVTAANAISTDITNLSNQLTVLSNRPLSGDGGAAVIASLPGKSLGMSFYADVHVATGGIFNYGDAGTLTNPSATPNTDPNAGLAVLAQACATDPVGNVASCNKLNSFTTTNLKSGVHFKGVALSEMGIALSHEFSIGKSNIAVAITPKVVKARLFDAQLKVNDSNNSSSVTGSDYLADYSFANFDIGAAKNYGNGWITGFVIKNVLPQTLDFKYKQSPTGESLTLKPQARIGISHSTSWSTVALDADLTRNDPAGFEAASQYIALGGELSAWGWVQLRAGYRLNLVDSDRNVTSVGLGFSPFGVVHADLAVAGNANEIGVSFQLGVHF